MIAPLSVEVGRPVRFEGYAEDYGVPIVTVNLLPARALGQRAWRGEPGAGYRYLYRLRAGRLGAAV